MDRRSFLKGVSLATAAGVAGVAVANAGSTARDLEQQRRVLAIGATRYRIDGGPRVHVSRDAGVTWAVHSYLGEGYALQRIRLDRAGRIRLTVAVDRRRRFDLVLSKSERAWLVA